MISSAWNERYRAGAGLSRSLVGYMDLVVVIDKGVTKLNDVLVVSPWTCGR